MEVIKCCKCKEERLNSLYINPIKPNKYFKTCIICRKEQQELRDFKQRKAKQDYLDCCRKNNIIPKRDTFLQKSILNKEWNGGTI